jgi:hypothetical protein
MSINLKYRLFRVANYGVLGTDNFKEKKILQIYNIFILLVSINVFIIGVLLWIFSFYFQIIVATSSLFALMFSLYLNKKGRTLISKIFIIQYFIICVLLALCVFSFLTIFPLFFFLIILYCTLIFSDKEKKLMLFFIIQCVLLLLLSLTSLYKLLPNYNLLPTSEFANMNFICIVGFIFFLFTFIYFHTDYQRKLELKYFAMNNRLQKRNESNAQNNSNNKKLLTIISVSLQQNLADYKTFFADYTNLLKNGAHQTIKMEELFEKMSFKNKKIEELINFRFTNNRDMLLKDNFERCIIQQKSEEIITKFGIKNTIVNRTTDFEIKIYSDLYNSFLIEILKEKKLMYKPKKIELNFHISTKLNLGEIDTTCFDLLGIKVHHSFDAQLGLLVIEICFLKNPDNTAIYYA